MNTRCTALALVASLLIAATCYGNSNKKDEFDNPPGPQQCGALALTLGTPAGLNLTFTNAVAPEVGLYASGMYWTNVGTSDETIEAGGFQTGVVLIDQTEQNFFRGWLISAGYSHLRNGGEVKNWAYGGFGHIWKYKLLYTQVDLTFGTGDFSSPQVGLQVGVVLKTLTRAPKK